MCASFKIPFHSVISKPNPYNQDTNFEKVPLKETYKNGMKDCYVPDLQEYMQISLSLYSVRIFYNKNLFQKLTGLKEPPHEYREFLAICDKIHSQTDSRGQPYISITGSREHTWVWETRMCDPLK